MNLMNIFRRRPEAAPTQKVRAMSGQAAEFIGFDDPRFLEFIRSGSAGSVSVKEAMRNPSVFRCVTLISYSIGMLPMHLIETETKEKAKDHFLSKILHREPNNWQTAFNFRQLMQRRALINGNAYALIVRSGKRIIRLVPLDPERVKPKQRKDWSVEYHYRPKSGEMRVLDPQEVLHVYADSEDGLSGTSMVKAAASAIELAGFLVQSQTELFKNGMNLGGALKHPERLGQEALDHLRSTMEENYSGVRNRGKWIVLEEGMEAQQFAETARNSQQIETRNMQVEEIGRIFGVPRPFLGVDDTSWGSGIDVLGQIFVRYALNPWFTAWEQATERSCMTDDEKERFDIKFNAGALLRGSMADQADFFAKALGSGGHQPWMEYPEVRELSDLPEREIAPNAMTGRATEGTKT